MDSGEPSPSNTPRMTPLSKLRKFLGLKSSPRPNTAPSRYSSYETSELDCDQKVASGNAFADLPVLEVRSETPRSRRTLHHSISSPALRKQSKAQLPSSNNDSKPPFLVISILGDLEPSLSKRRSKNGRPKTAISDSDRKASISLNDSRSSLRRKGSKLTKAPPCLPTPDAGVVDLSLSPEESGSASEGYLRGLPLQPIPWNQAVDPISPLSTTTFNSIYSHERALTSRTSVDTMNSLDWELAKENFCRKRSVNKIARTLGGCPPEYSRTIFAEHPKKPSDSGCSFSPAQLSPPLPSTGVQTKKIRRKSLTLSNLGSLPTLFRSNSQSITRATRPSSRNSLSTVNPDDVHKHGLGEDVWGELRDDTTGGTPISPILFNPPSPLPGPPKNSPWSEATPAVANSTDGSDSLRPLSPNAVASPSAPASRRHSLIGRPRSQSYVAARSSQQISPRPRTPFDYDPSLPVKANWLDQVSSTGPQSQQGQQEVEQPQLASQQNDWSGEWNQNNMLEVVRALRHLK